MKSAAFESEVTAEQVATFLEQHPDFFAGREALLVTQKLAHPSGQAISLLEKQNDLLRREAASNRERLHHLVATARDNDHLFLRLRSLVLSLLEAQDWGAVLAALETGLTKHFDVDVVQLVATVPWLPTDSPLVAAGPDEMAEQYATVLRSQKCWCGQLESAERRALFGEARSADAGSVAMAPLVPRGHGTAGMLVLGARDPDYFRSSMDTLFLNHVADVVSRLMVIWLPIDGEAVNQDRDAP